MNWSKAQGLFQISSKAHKLYRFEAGPS